MDHAISLRKVVKTFGEGQAVKKGADLYIVEKEIKKPISINVPKPFNSSSKQAPALARAKKGLRLAIAFDVLMTVWDFILLICSIIFLALAVEE